MWVGGCSCRFSFLNSYVDVDPIGLWYVHYPLWETIQYLPACVQAGTGAVTGTETGKSQIFCWIVICILIILPICSADSIQCSSFQFQFEFQFHVCFLSCILYVSYFMFYMLRAVYFRCCLCLLLACSWILSVVLLG